MRPVGASELPLIIHHCAKIVMMFLIQVGKIRAGESESIKLYLSSAERVKAIPHVFIVQSWISPDDITTPTPQKCIYCVYSGYTVCIGSPATLTVTVFRLPKWLRCP